LAILVSLFFLVWHLRSIIRSDRPTPVGNGRHVATYGFELSPCLIPPEEIIASGLPKDGLPAVLLPPLLTAVGVDSLNRSERGKYLVSTDRVVGVRVNGVARAYPLRVLNWHEVVNDTVGGLPLAVSFHPLSESVVVFAREVGGRVLEFGVSGLLFNSNLLMYDRCSSGEVRGSELRKESLWSQLLARAVTGPAAAARAELRVLPAAVVTWELWRSWYPKTTVPFPSEEFRQRYQRNPYNTYFGSDKLRFPVRPLPDPGARPFKARVVAVPILGRWTVYPLVELARRCNDQGIWLTQQDGEPLRFVCRSDPPVAAVFQEETGEAVPAIHCLWFSWYAFYSGAY
jgi:hypothetical protein